MVKDAFRNFQGDYRGQRKLGRGERKKICEDIAGAIMGWMRSIPIINTNSAFRLLWRKKVAGLWCWRFWHFWPMEHVLSYLITYSKWTDMWSRMQCSLVIPLSPLACVLCCGITCMAARDFTIMIQWHSKQIWSVDKELAFFRRLTIKYIVVLLILELKISLGQLPFFFLPVIFSFLKKNCHESMVVDPITATAQPLQSMVNSRCVCVSRKIGGNFPAFSQFESFSKISKHCFTLFCT